MDSKRNPFLMGALTAVVGVAVGAGSVLSAQLAFSGANPDYLKSLENPRLRGVRPTTRSYQQEDTQAAEEAREAAQKRRIERAQKRANTDRTHEAAREEVQSGDFGTRYRNAVRSCTRRGLTRGTRYTHCIGELMKGDTYQLRQTKLQ